MNVLFYGNGGSGNHGCEAISRGTVQLLDENKFQILSGNCQEDAQYRLNSIPELTPATESKKGASALSCGIQIRKFCECPAY